MKYFSELYGKSKTKTELELSIYETKSDLKW